MLEAGDSRVGARNHSGAIEVPGHRPMQDVFDERRLPAARYTGDRDEETERNLDVEIAQVVLARTFDPNDAVGIHPPAHFRNGDLQLTTQISPCNRFFIGANLVDGSLGDDQTAVLACARAKVDEMIRGFHRLLIVLDDDDSVAEVAELSESVEQACVVALVQTDGRLVEDVEDADEPRSNLRRETYALRFSPGE